MPEAFEQMKKVSKATWEDRTETVQELERSDTQRYALVKDTETGQHYLLYTMEYRNLQEGGEIETIDHIMPVNHDDVLAYVFQEEAYDFPDAWNKAYLRTGEGENLIWFDPAYLEEDEAIGQDIQDSIRKLNQQGDADPDTIRRFFKNIDNTFKNREDGSED